MISPFRRKPTTVDVLAMVVGHQNPDFLADTLESFDFHNRDQATTYGLAAAVDNNPDCASELARWLGPESVYCSPATNGWGRGILRTIAYALDHFRRNGLRWQHLVTIDSDALVVGPCIDQYVSKVSPGVCFVGQKWGGEGPYTSFNPGPSQESQRSIRHLVGLGLSAVPWRLLDYMVAGPFFLWTRQALDFVAEIGIFPGAVLDSVYPYINFPHDQMTTFVLGFEGHEFRDVGRVSMLHCGDVGGDESWKEGLPSCRIRPYGQIPVFEEDVGVIHPIRSSKFSEGAVRSFFRDRRTGTRRDWSTEELMDFATWNGRRLPEATWD